MTNLKDILRDLIQDVKDNENETDTNLIVDDEDLLDEYIEIITTRLIGYEI